MAKPSARRSTARRASGAPGAAIPPSAANADLRPQPRRAGARGAWLDEPPEPDSAQVLEQIKGPPSTLQGAAAHNVDGVSRQQATSPPNRRCHFAAHNVDGSFVGDRGV